MAPGLLSSYTSYLANAFCKGSARKLIAGWWYSILGLSVLLFMLSFVVMGNIPSEGFAAFWSGAMLLCLSIGGTMIMRKFHNSLAVGFFMGCLVAMAQMFFFLFLVYMGYGKDMAAFGGGKQESMMSFLSLCQFVLLGSFASILAAHRSDIIDKGSGTGVMDSLEEAENGPSTGGEYEAPAVRA